MEQSTSNNMNNELIEMLLDGDSYTVVYDKETATIAVENVLKAMKDVRLRAAKKYIGRIALVPITDYNGFEVQAAVVDVKVTERGVEFNVQPVGAKKMAWISGPLKMLS